jgi:hypothetical protein
LRFFHPFQASSSHMLSQYDQLISVGFHALKTCTSGKSIIGVLVIIGAVLGE